MIDENIKAIVEKYPNLKLVKVTKIASLTAISEQSDIVNGYWVVGEIVCGPTIDYPLIVERVANSVHPEGYPGTFFTSTIVGIADDIFITNNSKYQIEKLN